MMRVRVLPFPTSVCSHSPSSRPCPSLARYLAVQHNHHALSRTQIPFLSTPSRRPRVSRLITTETKLWLKEEAKRTAKYTFYIYFGCACVAAIVFGYNDARWERHFPTPAEWYWGTRTNFKQAMYREKFPGDDKFHIWSLIAFYLENVLTELENPLTDGQGIRERNPETLYVGGAGKMGFDITAKSENWRRGYYQTLMACGKAAEKLDGWVRKRGERFAYPAEVVLGPSNPDPRPVVPGSPPAPTEEEVEDAFFPPENFYLRILTTDGFNQKQKVDAALRYATWLDSKGFSDTASEMCNWAIDIATSTLPDGIIDPQTGVLQNEMGHPSANLLAATTALAVHRATKERPATALPIFISILRAQKALPDPPEEECQDALRIPPSGLERIVAGVKDLVIAPDYPAAPSDGTEVPYKTATQHCKEAAIMANISEIIFASARSRADQEDALAWTREAVDVASAEALGRARKDREAKETCLNCLALGLNTWRNILQSVYDDHLVKMEAAKEQWWSSESKLEEGMARWKQEEVVWRRKMENADRLIKQHTGDIP